MADFKIELTNADKIQSVLAAYPAQSREYLSRAINASLALIAKTAGPDSIFQFKTPRSLRTGLLSQTFGLGLKTASPDNLTGTIGPTVKYAAFVEYGTAPHLIQAVKARGLANRKAGLFFGKVVHHPGSQANPYMERILAAATPQIQATFEQAVSIIVGNMAI